MDYTRFPPGRNRGLAYFNTLMNRRRHHMYTRSFLFLRPISRHNIIFHDDNTHFGDFEFKDVKIGVSLSTLINNSEIKLQTNEQKGLCVICQDSIVYNDIIRIIVCSHTFHINCIDKWLSENNKCPLCKHQL